MNTNTMTDNLIFLLLINENGTEYSDPVNQKIVKLANEKESKTDIQIILHMLNPHREDLRDKKRLNIDIREYDMTIMNFDYLGKYKELINHLQTNIFSIDLNDERELSYVMLQLYEQMKTNDSIKQILYTRRRRPIGKKKGVFFLVKIFIDIEFPLEEIKTKILTIDTILNRAIKKKVSDKSIDKNNKLEQGVKKSNWINF